VEKNTFATSAYIDAPVERIYTYLGDLENLGEWTLSSKMLEQVDEDTWLGTASGYQSELFYHVRRFENTKFKGIEWHCGLRYGEYHQVYPVLLFPSQYVDPSSSESGAYFHWVSFVDPKRRTRMIKEGIDTVHNSECRSLKAVLERAAGHRAAVAGKYRIETDTIFVDAPIEVGVNFLRDVAQIEEWAHLLTPENPGDAGSGKYRNEYGQRVEASVEVREMGGYFLVEQDFAYTDHNFVQRSPTILIPCSYAFGDASALGFLLHRVAFFREDGGTSHGHLNIDDYGAENINIKRMVEARAGNLKSFAEGRSYRPDLP
jgi:hypothetical protein